MTFSYLYPFHVQCVCILLVASLFFDNTTILWSSLQISKDALHCHPMFWTRIGLILTWKTHCKTNIRLMHMIAYTRYQITLLYGTLLMYSISFWIFGCIIGSRVLFYQLGLAVLNNITCWFFQVFCWYKFNEKDSITSSINFLWFLSHG